MGWNGHRFHAALMLNAIGINLRHDRSKRNAFLRANIFQRNIKLDNASKGLHAKGAGIEFHCVFAAADGDFRLRESDLVPVFITVNDAFVYFHHAAAGSDVLDGEFQHSAFAAIYAQLINFPLQ